MEVFCTYLAPTGMGWLWIVTACSIRVFFLYSCRTALATPPLTEEGHLLHRINRANEIELIGHSNRGLKGKSVGSEVLFILNNLTT